MKRLVMVLMLVGCAVACSGSSIIVDAGFGYYKDRSPESVVDEITVNGFDDVRLVGSTSGSVHGPSVKAFNDAKVKTWLLTFACGVYGTQGLPEGWEKFKMKLRGYENNTTGFIFFCPNNPDYRAWKKKDIAQALTTHKFYGVDLAEPQMPGGPEAAVYGCLCDHCLAAFRKMHPNEPNVPEFSDANSPRYWKTDKVLYEKWVAFRVATVTGYLDDVVNGKEGIREKCKDAKVCTWTLGLDVPDQLAKLKEYYGLDSAAVVKKVKPDYHCIQTDWPDWIRADLKPEYVLSYKPVADSIRKASPTLPLLLQSDIGSQPQMRRSREWMDQLKKHAKTIGLEQVTSYEYFIGGYIYTEEPKPMKATFEKPATIRISFNKRLDPGTAASPANYSIDTGRIDSVTVDGSVVRLSVSGAGKKPTVTVSGLSDDDSRRLFRDKPAVLMTQSQQVTVK